VRRGLVVRFGVTVLAVAVMVQTYLWYGELPGPARAFAIVLAVVADGLCVAMLHWAWKRHPF